MTQYFHLWRSGFISEGDEILEDDERCIDMSALRSSSGHDTIIVSNIDTLDNAIALAKAFLLKPAYAKLRDSQD